MPLPSVDISKGAFTDSVALVKVIGCLDYIFLTPEKAFFSHARTFFLLWNGGAEVLRIQREENEITMEAGFPCYLQGPWKPELRGWNGYLIQEEVVKRTQMGLSSYPNCTLNLLCELERITQPL